MAVETNDKIDEKTSSSWNKVFRFLAWLGGIFGAFFNPLVAPNLLWWPYDHWAEHPGWWLSFLFLLCLWFWVGGLAFVATVKFSRKFRFILAPILGLFFLTALIESGYHTVYFTRYFSQLDAIEQPPDPLYEVLDESSRRYRLRPGTQVNMPSERDGEQTVPVTINLLGMRDTKVRVSVNEKALRILFVGDSVTFGPKLPIEETFPQKTATLLENDLNREVQAFNFGIPGYNLPEIAQFRSIVPWEVIHPNLLVYAVCLNDAHLEEEIYDPATRSLVPRHRFSAVVWGIRSLVLGEERELGRLLDQVLEQSVADQQAPVVVLLPTAPYLRGIPEENANSDRKAAAFFRKHLAEKNVPVLDLLDAEWPQPVEENYLPGPDPAHFSTKGSRFVADRLVRFLETFLQKQ